MIHANKNRKTEKDLCLLKMAEELESEKSAGFTSS